MWFLCKCCTEDKVLEIREVHHITPRCYGGLDNTDNLVELCDSCHTLIHRAANLNIKGKSSQDLLDRSFNYKADRIKNAINYASLIVEAHKNSVSYKNTQEIMIKLDFNFYHVDVKDAAKACHMPIYKFFIEAIKEKVMSINGFSSNIDISKTTKKPTLKRKY